MTPDVRWEETEPDSGVFDLWVDGRIVDYDVPEHLMEDALRRARVEPE